MLSRDIPNIPTIWRNVPTNATFSSAGHSDIERDSVGQITRSTGERYELALKKTPYQIGPEDLLLLPTGTSVSQIIELSPDQCASFWGTAALVASEMLQISGHGMPVIAVNQQLECRSIPQKYLSDGTEVKVQTINALHAHVFLERGDGERYDAVPDLPEDARNDFCDPFGALISPIVARIMRNALSINGASYSVNVNTHTLPLGAECIVPLTLTESLASPAILASLVNIQHAYNGMYQGIKDSIMNADGTLKHVTERAAAVKQFSSELPERSRRILVQVARNLKPETSQEPRKHMRFIQGPAFTWIVYEKDRCTHINLTPRILSRGNAMEALGIWVEQEGKNDGARLEQLLDYYRHLNSSLARIGLDIQKGALLSYYDKR